MYWLNSVILDNGEVSDAETLHSWTIVASITAEIPGLRSLRVHVGRTENEAGHDSYTLLMAQALQLLKPDRQAFISLIPLAELALLEQQAVRAWLIGQRWPAWARASPEVRNFLGASEAPVLLADAARHMWMPLTTLQSAAADERLPTIRTAGRHLVYTSTILEAQQRGLLHSDRGRPQRRKR